MKQPEPSLSDWIEEKAKRGYYTFSVKDIRAAFPKFGNAYIRTALYRLVIKKEIISPWRGFYVIMPIEFALKAVIPPVFFMDALMAFLNKKYYVCLLNAASFYGAAHQRVQSFSVMTEAPKLRNTTKTGTSILFFSKKDIPDKYIQTHKVQSGYVNVSSPELTTLDLIENEKNVGGLNRVCTVLNELADAIDWTKLDDSFFSMAPHPVYQRLGFILETVLKREEIAKKFKEKFDKFEFPIRAIPFKIGKSIQGCDLDKQWKVIINQKIEIDE